MLQLYHNDMSTCSQKVRFVLHEKQLDWEGEELDLRAGDQMRPEFLAINPKGLVPALIHDGETIIESNIIIDYLDDAFPEPALKPLDPLQRAKMRLWMKRLDDGLHLEVAALSFAIAFREQLIAACGSDEALEAHLASIHDPYIQGVQREVVPTGIESPRFAQAILAFDKMLADMDAALRDNACLMGDKLTLADIAFAPYATRLDHLALEMLWKDKPNYARWYEAVCTTPGYQAGIAKWFNPKYLPLMRSAGEKAAPKVHEILSENSGTQYLSTD